MSWPCHGPAAEGLFCRQLFDFLNHRTQQSLSDLIAPDAQGPKGPKGPKAFNDSTAVSCMKVWSET